jgi:hypothetical protein
MEFQASFVHPTGVPRPLVKVCSRIAQISVTSSANPHMASRHRLHLNDTSNLLCLVEQELSMNDPSICSFRAPTSISYGFTFKESSAVVRAAMENSSWSMSDNNCFVKLPFSRSRMPTILFPTSSSLRQEDGPGR